ncbi:hypothetical protein [Allokutzneria albata]|uniref:hypothetical protein n=1 Tax=Allokutzneria albata TaxID=211114 RepID=UPI0012DD7E29|nr:hypothetical protein [Allokutzneria albata]
MKVVQEMLGCKTLAITSDLYTSMLPQLGIEAAARCRHPVLHSWSPTGHPQDHFSTFR